MILADESNEISSIYSIDLYRSAQCVFLLVTAVFRVSHFNSTGIALTNFYLDFADIQIQLSSLSDILEQIKTNTTTTSSVSSKSIVKISFFFIIFNHWIFIFLGWG
jgi:hypothetical protein